MPLTGVALRIMAPLFAGRCEVSLVRSTSAVTITS